MRLSFSNIAWQAPDDDAVLRRMQSLGFTGLEIAPTRVFNDNPYDNLSAAAEYAAMIKKKYSLGICSMQSIWYKRGENIFVLGEERDNLLRYSFKAVDFAAAVGCRNLVLGCPKNRNIPDGADINAGEDFIYRMGRYAENRGCIIGIEANPPVYNTNFINRTADAFALCEKLDCKGIGVNLDFGTILANNEDVNIISGKTALISHIHISEIQLKAVQPHESHRTLADILRREGYRGFVSGEAGNCGADETIKAAGYIKEVFE